MALIEVPCERAEYAGYWVGQDIAIRLGAARTAFPAVVVATKPHERQLLVEIPDGLVSIHPDHPLGAGE